MDEQKIKKESFLKKYRDKIIVGIIITLVSGVILVFVTGAATVIYNWFLGTNKIEKLQQDGSSTAASDLPTGNLSIRGYSLTDLSTTTTRVLLEKIRGEHGVRQLLALESGKKLNDVPNATYSFLSPFFIEVSSYEDFSFILRQTTERFSAFYGGDFEVHKISNDEIYLLGFASEEGYTNMSSGNIKTITLFPYPIVDRKYLLVIPFREIKESEHRKITFDDGYYIIVLDLNLNLVK